MRPTEQERAEAIVNVLMDSTLAGERTFADIRDAIILTDPLTAYAARLEKDRDMAQSACDAWRGIFENIQAHIQDRVGMNDPAKPDFYLSIIRSDVAGVLKTSSQICAARWAHHERQQAQIAQLEAELATARADKRELVEGLRIAEGHLADDLNNHAMHPIGHCPVLDHARALIARHGGGS